MVRIKQRYLLLNILYPDQQSHRVALDTPQFVRFRAPTPQHVDRLIFTQHLKSHISHLFGDQGLGLCLSSLRLVYFSNATSTVILRVPKAHYQIVWAALSYMTELPAGFDRNVPKPKCVVRVVHVSGTIRKAEDELIRRSRRDIVQARLSGKGVPDTVLGKSTIEDDVALLPSADLSSSSEMEGVLSASDSD